MVMARKDGEEGWRGRMMKKVDDFSPYALVSLCTRLPTHLSPYALVFLRICLPTHSTPHCLCNQKIFPAMGTICILSTCRGMKLPFLERHWIAWSLSGWLDVIKLALPLCRHQPCHLFRHERMTRDEEVPRANPERLHPSRRCLCPQHCQHSSQEPELSHLFQLRPKKSLCIKMSQAKERQWRRRLVTVLATSALMRLTWTVPRRLPSNEFFAFDTRFNSGKINVSFDGQDGHNSHIGFEAGTVAIAMSVSMARTVTIAMNVSFDSQDCHNSHVGFEANTVAIAISVSMARTVMIAMNVGFDSEDAHDSHGGFEATTFAIAMSVLMARAVTIARNVGFDGQYGHDSHDSFPC